MPHRYGFATQFRIVALFYGSIESVHINMYNLTFGHYLANYRYKDTLIFVHSQYAPVDINKSGNEE